MSLTNSEYNQLRTIEKEFKDNTQLIVGPSPIHWSRDILSKDRSEQFILDCYRGSFEVKKFTYNKRYRQSIVIARLDSMGRHTNPDDSVVVGPHVHLYTEGFGDKFAYPISSINLSDPFTIEEGLLSLLTYFNVTNIPSIQTAVV